MSATLKMKLSEHETVRRAELVAVADIAAAPYNPPARTASTALSRLLASMEEVGLLYPLLIDENRVLIDGHRRLACAKALGWPTVACVTIPGEDVAREKAYATVNANSRKMSGNDQLRIWLASPLAVDRKVALQYEQMRDDLGLAMLKHLAKSGHSETVWRVARRLAFYLDKPSGFLPEAVKWITEHGNVGQVRRALANGEPPRIFLDAMRKKCGLRSRFAVDERE